MQTYYTLARERTQTKRIFFVCVRSQSSVQLTPNFQEARARRKPSLLLSRNELGLGYTWATKLRALGLGVHKVLKNSVHSVRTVRFVRYELNELCRLWSRPGSWDLGHATGHFFHFQAGEKTKEVTLQGAEADWERKYRLRKHYLGVHKCIVL